MPFYKSVCNFASFGSNGGFWSEVYYFNTTSLARAAAWPDWFTVVRLNLLNNQNKFLSVRTSQVGAPRVAVPTPIGKFGLDGLSAPAPVDSAVVCSLGSSEAGASRKLWLRGWSVDSAKRDPTNSNDVFAGGFVDNLAAWFETLALNGGSILVRTRTNVPNFDWINVVSVDGSNPGPSTDLTLEAPSPSSKGELVTIGKMSKKDFPGLNGVYMVTKVAGNVVTIPYTVANKQKLIPETGHIRPVVYLESSAIDPTLCGPQYIGGRKSRSPYSRSRGARSADRKIRSEA